MKKENTIFIAGGNGVAGSAIKRQLEGQGYSKVFAPTHSDLDLTNQSDVNRYFKENKPEYVFFVAAKMGSIIYRNEHPADIFEQNLIMQNNVISAAHNYQVKKLLFMSSDFIYPNTESGMLQESDFFTNIPGERDLPYSLAKISAVKMCDFYRQQYNDNFFTVVPCAFFGRNSSFDLQRASVVASLIKRFDLAKKNSDDKFVLWGSGKPVKEFLLSEDIASACIFLMENYEDGGIVNIGAGDGGHSIMEIARIISRVVGYKGSIECDLSKPDGIMRRVMNTDKITKLGWEPKYSLEEAIKLMYEYYLEIES